MSESEDVISIYSPGNFSEWSRTSSRRKRPLKSVILEPKIKDAVLADALEFLDNEEWYVERGIPYRRGYLLVGLDVYIVSLSKPDLNDSKLNALFCAMPPRSILLIEDIDAVFQKVTAVRKTVAATLSKNDDFDRGMLRNDNDNERLGNVTLSGLLNALDGIAASEGRLLFATTNCVTALDEALIRPGRMDVHVEFTNATSWQAKELFRSFFEPRKHDTKERKIKIHTEINSAGTQFAMLTVREFVNLYELIDLSEQFAKLVPADVFSVASLQGYLMLYKSQPQSALEHIERWVDENLKKEDSDKENGEECQ
ncbi:hypothetical protein Clacol_001204 [Clathrus columnatus]|uniref:ATPase AAA-type core domain-containing protein n=1 Tax=Clathrus columnatus TaxID=1419009 RepID=A0AAV4ZXT9_9AGAM|nr:hypothetical protein Clacol_001204 [Clathrus columnatus]